MKTFRQSVKWVPVVAAGLALALIGVGTMSVSKVEAAAKYSPEHPFIAGVKPNQRPEGAPVIKKFEKDGAWYRRALHGIPEPYPWSLHFLEDQGPWYTPFIHPGMLPPYDIRGWHSRVKARKTASVKPRPRKKLHKQAGKKKHK